MNFQLSDKAKDILEWVLCIVIAVVLALLVRYFVGTPTIVKQPSMYPTLKEDQRLILNRIGKTMKKMPERGDIITFESPTETYIPEQDVDLNHPVAVYKNEDKGFFGNFLYYVLEFRKTSFIKRAIGMPGDHVEIKEEKVFINGKELDEPYLQPGVVTDSLGGAFTDFIVPDGYIFAMGDNRNQSTDCRRFGCIPLSKIEGNVVLRFWPLNVFGTVK